MIDLFRRHAEREDPDFAEHFYIMGATSEFQHTITYLRSPETDALFLERLQYGLDNSDNDLLVNCEFLLEHASEVIERLMYYLDNRDAMSRTTAASALQQITGLQVPWDDSATAAGNVESAARLRAEAEWLLSQYSPVVTGGSLADQQDAP